MASATDRVVHGRVHIHTCQDCGQTVDKITQSPTDTGNPLYRGSDGIVYITGADKKTPKIFVCALFASSVFPMEIFTQNFKVGMKTAVVDNEAEKDHLAVCSKASAAAKKAITGSKSEHKKN